MIRTTVFVRFEVFCNTFFLYLVGFGYVAIHVCPDVVFVDPNGQGGGQTSAHLLVFFFFWAELACARRSGGIQHSTCYLPNRVVTLLIAISR